MTYLRESGLFTGPSDFEASISACTESALVRSLVLRALPEERRSGSRARLPGHLRRLREDDRAESPGRDPRGSPGRSSRGRCRSTTARSAWTSRACRGAWTSRGPDRRPRARRMLRATPRASNCWAEDLSALLAGQWSLRARFGLSLDADIDIKAESLTRATRGSLPESGAARSASMRRGSRARGRSPARPRAADPGRAGRTPGRAGIEARRAPTRSPSTPGWRSRAVCVNLGVPMTDADGGLHPRLQHRRPRAELRDRTAGRRPASPRRGVENARALDHQPRASDAVDIAYATASPRLACLGLRQILSNAPGKGRGRQLFPRRCARAAGGVILADLSAVAGADHHAAARRWRGGSTYRADVILAGSPSPLLEELQRRATSAPCSVRTSPTGAAAERPIDQSRGLSTRGSLCRARRERSTRASGVGDPHRLRERAAPAGGLPVDADLELRAPRPTSSTISGDVPLLGATARFDNIALALRLHRPAWQTGTSGSRPGPRPDVQLATCRLPLSPISSRWSATRWRRRASPARSPEPTSVHCRWWARVAPCPTSSTGRRRRSDVAGRVPASWRSGRFQALLTPDRRGRAHPGGGER